MDILKSCRRLSGQGVLAVASLGLFVSLSANLSASHYTLVDLGDGVARDINASGHVVGNANTGAWQYDGTNRATLKISAHFLGGSTNQGLFFTAATANAINDHGRIVGSVVFIPLHPESRRAFFTDGNGVATLIDLGDATGLNEAGLVVGGDPAFILDGASLGAPAGILTRLNSVNENGLSVGSVAPDGVAVAASFSGNSFSQLKLQALSLPDTGNPADYQSIATAVNDAGQIVGNVTLKSNPPAPTPGWAFLFKGNKATRLDTLGGAFVSAQDINNNGVVVGSSTLADESLHAFVYEGGTITDLNQLVTGAFGWVLSSANAINDNGLIVGEGKKDGAQHSYLLKPVSDNVPPSITVPPAGSRAFVGDSVRLVVGATGAIPLSYQWRHAGTNLPGATASTYVLAHASALDAGGYRVVVTNPFGSVTSDEAMLEVQPKNLEPAVLSVALYAGILITGQVGRSFQIEAVENATDTNWELLATVTLDISPYLWIDTPGPLRRGRLYRAVPVP